MGAATPFPLTPLPSPLPLGAGGRGRGRDGLLWYNQGMTSKLHLGTKFDNYEKPRTQCSVKYKIEREQCASETK